MRDDLADSVPQSIALGAPIKLHFLASSSMLPDTADKQALCTWPLDTTEGRSRLHHLLAVPSPSLWDICERGGTQICVTDLAVSYGEFESEDKPGEIQSGPIFYLLCGGNTWHTGSVNVYRSLRELAKLEGPPPWFPPVILRAERHLTRNHRTMLTVVFVGRDLENAEEQ